MNNNIVSKVSIFSELTNSEQAIAKFSASIVMNTYDDLVEKYEFLKLSGITITLASELKVFCLSLDELKNQVALAKQYGYLPSLLKADVKRGQHIGPTLMLYKSLDKRLEYAVKNNISYRNEDGYIFDNIVNINIFNSVVNKDFDVVEEIQTVASEPETNTCDNDLVTDWLESDEISHSDAVWDLWGGEILSQLESIIETTPDEAMSSRLLKLLDLVEQDKITMKDAFFYAITFHKTLPELEKEKYRVRIDECLTDDKISKYSSILTSNVEGVAS